MNSEYVGPVMTASPVEYGRIEWAARCIDQDCEHSLNSELFMAGYGEEAARAYVQRSRRKVELVSRYTAPWQVVA